MNDISRSSTLSVRRPAAAALASRPKASSSSVPVVERKAPVPVSSAGKPLHSEALLQGHSHISILHNGETYQLRATRLGKLILTK